MNNSETIGITFALDVIRDHQGVQCCGAWNASSNTLRVCKLLSERNGTCKVDDLPIDESDNVFPNPAIRPHDKCIIRKQLIRLGCL